MMNKEMLNRIKIAGEYQRKAIYALFPEEMNEHLGVIEKELKMMAIEVMTELLKEFSSDDACKNEQGNEKTSRVKKVDIL